MNKIFLSMILLGAVALPAQAGLVGLYQFNNPENLGLDNSGQNNNATNFGAAYSNTGYNGGSALFYGTQFLRAPINVAPNAMPSMTWGAWVKPTATNPVRAVLSTDNCCYDRDIDIDSRGGSLSWSAFTGNGVLSSGVPLSTSDWAFLAVSYDQQAQTMSLYVNNNPAVTAHTNFDLIGNNGFLDIAHNPSYGEYFAGYIDNVFIYDQTLNAGQIAAIKNGGFSVDEPNLLMLMVLAMGTIARKWIPKNKIGHNALA